MEHRDLRRLAGHMASMMRRSMFISGRAGSKADTPGCAERMSIATLAARVLK